MPRPKGSKNKVSSYARLRLAELKCDPIERAVYCANVLLDEGETAQAGKLYNDLIPYIAPKLAAMQVSGDEDNPVSFNITLGARSAD